MGLARGTPVVVVLAVATLVALPLAAQAPTGAVTGVVHDSASQPLVNVQVRAVDLASGLTYRAFSSSAGRYWLRGLPPGSYDITAERIGLRATTVRGVELAVGRTATIDFTLPAAAVQFESLVVAAGAPLIETTRSKVSYVLDRQRIEQLPEESRNFIALARLVPGATTGTESTGAFPGFGADGSSVGALNRRVRAPRTE